MHPLKSRQGDVVPLTPTRFLEKAGQKLLRVTAEMQINKPNEVSLKSFLSTFFQKSGQDFQGRQPLNGGAGAKPPQKRDYQGRR